MDKTNFYQNSIWNLITLIAFIITIIAFAISIYQSYQARKQSQELESHTNQLLQNSNDLREIMGAMSTKFVGSYPDYLENVIALLNKACKEIKIICSIPTPYIFGNPSVWLKYEQVMAKQVFNNIDISIITLTESERRKRLEQEFHVAKSDWKGWFNERKGSIENFLKRYFQDEKIEELDYSKLIALLLSIQNRKLDEVYKQNGIKVIECEHLLPIHIWIIDNREAVFSIQNMSIGKDNQGFKTSDQGLINSLIKMTELFKMNTHTRIDSIIVTKDLDKSIRFYKDVIGLEMRPICNPVAIFKYDYASLYIYNESFFTEQFGIAGSEVVANGMLSIQINNIENYDVIIKNLGENQAGYFELLTSTGNKFLIKDFNNFILEIWHG